MSFSRDLLFLYNHSDEANATLNGIWRIDFVKNLQFAFRKLVDKEIVIHSFNASDQNIQRELINSKLAIVLVDDPFLESNISDEILKLFAKNHISLDNEETGYQKLIPLIASNFPREMYPEPIKNLEGYDFTSVRMYEKMVKEKKGSVGQLKREQVQWLKIVDLAKDTIIRLQFVDRQIRKKPVKNKTIYLAQTTPDLVDIRDSIKRDLKRHGYYIYPEQFFVSEEKNLEKTINKFLTKSLMSIHLIGEEYGAIIKDRKSIIDIQHKLAEEHSARINSASGDKQFFRIIWINPENENTSVIQNNFTNKIKRDIELKEESELLQSPMEELKTFIRNQLAKLNNPKPNRLNQIVSDSDKNSIYLIFDRKDYTISESIKNILLEKGFDVMIPEFNGGVFEIENVHRDKLISCDGCLLIADQVSKKWIATKLKDIDKINGLGRDKPIQAKAIYTTINGGQEKELPVNNGTIIISNRGKVDAEVIKPFLHKFSSGND